MTETSSDPDGVDHGEEQPGGGSGIVFVCDASAEAERLMGALRNRGYSAFDVPLGLLPTRIRYETPDVVVVDADAHEAARLIGETRAASSISLRLVLLGQADGALSRDPSLAEGSALVFTRPLDISKAADAVRELLGPPPPRPGPRLTVHRSGRAPVLVASARKPYRTDVAPPSRPFVKSEPLESHWPIASPPSLGATSHESALGMPDSVASSRTVSHSSSPPSDGIASLSPETRALLDQARRRVQSHPAQPSRPSRLGVDHTTHGTVAPDLLLALSEPLGLAEASPEEGNTNTNDTSGGLNQRSLTRGTTDRPGTESGGSTGHDEAEQTNPGGRPPSRGPEATSDGEPAPEGLVPALALSLPPLDDLSDLLHQPLAGLPLYRFSPGDDATDPGKNDAPSTAPAGRRGQGAGRPPSPRDATAHVPAPAPPPQPAEAGTEARPLDADWEPKPPIEALALAVRQRRSGALAQETPGGVRRVLLRDGDLLTLTSSSDAESLVQYLEDRGDLTPGVLGTLSAVPKFGRHAGAALIAQGYLRQEDLWPVLRAHAEWLLGRVLSAEQALVLDANVPARLLEEPAVFGGAAGAEVYLDVLQRVVEPNAAFERLGSGERTLDFGAQRALLTETALTAELERSVQDALGQPLTRTKDKNPGLLVVLLGLVELGVLTVGDGTRAAPRAEIVRQKSVEMDDDAFGALIGARRALVEDGDYFVILGIPRSATRYEIDRAREQLRRELDATRLTGRTAHLRSDLDLVLTVVDEAHLVLSDDVRRERYRRALENFPL